MLRLLSIMVQNLSILELTRSQSPEKPSSLNLTAGGLLQTVLPAQPCRLPTHSHGTVTVSLEAHVRHSTSPHVSKLTSHLRRGVEKLHVDRYFLFRAYQFHQLSQVWSLSVQQYAVAIDARGDQSTDEDGSERLPEFLRVDRVNSEIKTHPEAFGVAEEEERQNKG